MADPIFRCSLLHSPDATEAVLLKQIDRLNTLIVVTESERNEAQKKAEPSKSLKTILEKRAGNADAGRNDPGAKIPSAYPGKSADAVTHGRCLVRGIGD